jgi:cytochrome c oxidase cbb3-type subunit 3
MSSRFRASLLILGAAAIALAACDREERHSRAKPLGETVPAGQSPDTIWPGGTSPPPLDARAKLYDNNAPAIAEGQTLYTQMNCVGCHFHGGGGMGPPLMDDEWRYGGRIDQIAASIAEGRPNGMPAWRNKLTDDQIWKIAAYVRTLSGQPSKDAVSSRTEEMSNTAPQTLTPREPAHSSDTADQ